MKVTKKIVSLVMAVVMLASLFVISASALSYNPTMTTGEVGVILKADKTTVNPGDTVTFSIYIDKGTKSDLGAWMTTLVYNSKHLTPTSTDKTGVGFREYVNDAATYMKQSSTVNHNFPIRNLKTLTADEKAYYDKACMMNGVVDTGLATNTVGAGWEPTDANTAQCTFTMTVAEGLAPGTEIWIGNHEATYKANVSYLGNSGVGRFPLADNPYNLSQAMVKLTVASNEPVAPTTSLARKSAAVKFAWTDASKTAVQDAFDFRVRSTISTEEFDKLNTEKGVKSVGFVVSDAAAWDDAAAKDAVATPGNKVGNYKAGATNYVYNNAAAGVYEFGAVLKTTKTALAAGDLKYKAFVEMNDGSVVFYDAEFTLTKAAIEKAETTWMGQNK